MKPQPETRTNPGHDYSHPRFAFLVTFAERQPCHLKQGPKLYSVDSFE